MCNVELMQKAPCTADKPDCTVNINEAKKNCMQPKEVGPCRGYFPRWYYDVGRTMCLQFIYGGCRGNSNNFDRYADCHRMCETMLRGKAVNAWPPNVDYDIGRVLLLFLHFALLLWKAKCV
ncbi:UNVERIFIED_CONTAM: Aplp2 [Trichonephila clavipes]